MTTPAKTLRRRPDANESPLLPSAREDASCPEDEGVSQEEKYPRPRQTDSHRLAEKSLPLIT